MPNLTDLLLTTGAAALLAKRSPATIRLWRRSGRLVPAVCATSGLALYARHDVERVVAERQSPAQPVSNEKQQARA